MVLVYSSSSGKSPIRFSDDCGDASGRRPTYRDVLLRVREKLHVPCSVKLSTEDMEAEIFLHLLQDYSRCFAYEEYRDLLSLWSLFSLGLAMELTVMSVGGIVSVNPRRSHNQNEEFQEFRTWTLSKELRAVVSVITSHQLFD